MNELSIVSGYEKPNCTTGCPTYADLDKESPNRLVELGKYCSGVARIAGESEFTGFDVIVCDSPLLQEPDHGIKESVYIDRRPV